MKHEALQNEPTPSSHGLELRERELTALLDEAVAEYKKAKEFENGMVKRLKEEQRLSEEKQSGERIQTYQEIIQTMQEIQSEDVSFLEKGLEKLKYLSKGKREEFERKLQSR